MTMPNHMRLLQKRFTALAVFIFGLWLIQALNWVTGYSLNSAFGLVPRQLRGLDGVVGMPFLHVSFSHLSANTVPLLLMGSLLAVTATRGLLAINAVIVGLGGALVWVFGSSAIHVGASGLVFGWFGFLISRGFVDRSTVTLGAAILVGLIYWSIIWGVLPGQLGVSWEAHLFGAFAGAVAALVIRSHVHSPIIRGAT